MIQAQEPVARFAEQYNGVDRSRYEKAVLAAERPLINYIDLTGATKSVLWSRAASLQMIRARVFVWCRDDGQLFCCTRAKRKILR